MLCISKFVCESLIWIIVEFNNLFFEIEFIMLLDIFDKMGIE